jgi:hypothetical protein
VLMLLLWRFGGRTPRVATAGAVTVVALPLLIIGPLRHSPPAWNSANVSETLTGNVIRNGTQLKQIVSFVGQAGGPQKLLLRADLLVAPARLESTSLQLEYLPSGDVCRGRVRNIAGESFSGTCRLPNGQQRTIDANWVPNAAGTGAVGNIQVHS